MAGEEISGQAPIQKISRAPIKRSVSANSKDPSYADPSQALRSSQAIATFTVIAGIATSTAVARRRPLFLLRKKKPLREPDFSIIRPPAPIRSRESMIPALRAFAVKGASVATPIRLDKKKDASLRISRPLDLDFPSPGFASVHSLAGRQAGSSIGLTMDYQFLDRLYLSTGPFTHPEKTMASAPKITMSRKIIIK